MKSTSLIKHLPVSLSLIVASFIYFSLHTQQNLVAQLGRPSSTHAIGDFLLPFVAVFWGAVTALVSFVVSKFMRVKNWDWQVPKGVFITMTIAAIFSASGIATLLGVNSYADIEAAQEPRVLVRNNVDAYPIRMMDGDTENLYQWSRLDNDDTPQYFSWQGKDWSVADSESCVLRLSQNNEVKYQFDNLCEYSYLTSVQVMPMTVSEDVPYLVLLAKLRATSQRSLLIILDSDLNERWVEVVERCRLGINLSAQDDGLVVNSPCAGNFIRLE